MKRYLIASATLNVLFVAGLIVIGVYTSFWTDIASRIGLTNKRIVFNQKAEDCLRGWTKSLESLHDTVDLAFLGNSITYGGDFDQAFPQLKICNLGYPSDDLSGMQKRIAQIKALHPKLLFIMAGTNNLSTFNEKSFKCDYNELITEIKKNVPNVEIYIQSILPYNSNLCEVKFKIERHTAITKANEIIKKISEESGVNYIDLYSLYVDEEGQLQESLTVDGVHLKNEAYERWYNEIGKYIYD